MSTEPNPIAVTLLVTQVLDKLQVPYVVVGSLASSYYGLGRSSYDSDIVVDMKEENIPAFAKQLGSDFYIDEVATGNAIRSKGSFNLVHRPSAFRVDIFVSKKRPFDQIQLERRKKMNLEEYGVRTAYLASAEDTLLGKLEWFRLGNEISDRQWQDILGILQVQKGNLDMQYMQQWASSMGLSDLFTRAVREAAID